MQQVIAGRVVIQRHVSPKDRQSWLICLEMENGTSVTLGFDRGTGARRDQLIALEGQACELIGRFGRHIFLVQEVVPLE